MAAGQKLKQHYPWIDLPLVVSAPMLGASTAALARAVCEAGGIGFLAGGVNPEALDQQFTAYKSLLEHQPLKCYGSTVDQLGSLPVGVGFQLFNCPLDPIADVIARHRPSIAWLFAPKETDDLQRWAEKIREVTGNVTKIWIQVGTVSEAIFAESSARPDVLVLQGSDAGGHGLVKSASVITLVPEAVDALGKHGSETPVLAAGGIVDHRGLLAALALGASGAVMGTRFLASKEAGIADGWKRQVLQYSDGGVSTLRSTLCDRLKETKGWPAIYDGRAIRNKAHVSEAEGMSDEDNVRLYKKDVKLGDTAWGPDGRLVTYAGTGVGLIQGIESAADIVTRVVTAARKVGLHE